MSATTIVENEACIPNISTAERRKRLTFGVMTLVIALAILGILLATGTSRWWRLALYPVFVSAMIGFFQWGDKTCVALARRGTRKLAEDTEEKKIEDPEVLAQVRRQARAVNIKGILVAIPITLIAFVLPVL